LSTDPNEYPKITQGLPDGEGNPSSIPNPASRAIVNFMTKHNLPYLVVFVATRPSKDSKSIGLKKGSELLFNSSGDNVYMQPFVVFRNKQNNPIFFPIDGYEEPQRFADSDYSGDQHGIQFAE
jgi:hypothetical protein